jgi:hypothetical protein
MAQALTRPVREAELFGPTGQHAASLRNLSGVPNGTSAATESAYELRSGGPSHETQSDLGLCSVVVLVVVHSDAQRAFVIKPLVEKKVARCRSSLLALQPRPWWRTHEFLTHRCRLRWLAVDHTMGSK